MVFTVVTMFYAVSVLVHLSEIYSLWLQTMTVVDAEQKPTLLGQRLRYSAAANGVVKVSNDYE